MTGWSWACPLTFRLAFSGPSLPASPLHLSGGPRRLFIWREEGSPLGAAPTPPTSAPAGVAQALGRAEPSAASAGLPRVCPEGSAGLSVQRFCAGELVFADGLAGTLCLTSIRFLSWVCWLCAEEHQPRRGLQSIFRLLCPSHDLLCSTRCVRHSGLLRAPPGRCRTCRFSAAGSERDGLCIGKYLPYLCT